MNDQARQALDLAAEPDFAIGAMTVKPSACEVEFASEAHKLEPRVMQVLVALAQARGAVVSRDDLIQTCWSGVIVGDDAINRVLGKVRRLSELGPSPAFKLETIPKIGYRLIALAPEAGIAPAKPRFGLRLTKLQWIAAASAGGVAVIAAALVFFALPGGERVVVRRPDMVELRPIRVLDAKPGMEAFAQQTHSGMKRILASNQVAVVEGAAEPRSVAAKDFEFVLSGTLEQSADEYAVTLYFDNREDGQTLWSHRFSRAIADGEGLREEVGANAAFVIGCGLKQRTEARVKPTTPAFKIYFELCGQSKRDTESTVLAAAQRLIAIAPDDAHGHGMAAIANSLIAIGNPDLSKNQVELHKAAARKAAARALELDPENAYAQFAKAVIAPGAEYWLGVEAFVQRMGADHPMIRDKGMYTGSLRSSGRLKEALHLVEQRAARSPLSVWANTLLAVMNMHVGNHEAADRLLEEALQLSPGDPSASWYRFVNAAFYGNAETALTLLSDKSKALDLDLGQRACWQMFIDARSRAGNSAGRAALRQACDGHFNWELKARMLAGLGDIDGAYEVAQGMPFDWAGSTTFLFYPEMAPFRQDPRFMPIIAQSGLLEFWTKSGRWPDFCAEPGLPYDCKAAAARALEDNRPKASR